MRDILKAALLLGPALVSALVEPVEDGQMARPKLAGHPLALIVVEIPSVGSPPDESVSLPFQIQALPSEQPCGYGNVTINGQELAQEVPDGEDTTSIGSGSVTSQGAIVDATWLFECLSVNGNPNLQLLRFLVTAVDGTPVGEMEQPGFTVLFTQTGVAQILRINTDLSALDMVPFPETVAPVNDDDDYREARMDEELADLDWMISQLKELEYLIAEKQAAIAGYTSTSFEGKIGDCDSLKCVVKALRRKIRYVTRKIYNKVGGNHEDGQDFEEWKPYKKHHWFNNLLEKENHTHPHPRPPHWRRPHRPLPICRFPPPHHPSHSRPPHRRPHDGPPHDGPPHDGPPHDGPPHDGPPHDGPPHDGPPHDGPPHDGPPHDGPYGPPGHHKPSRPGRPGHRRPGDQKEMIPGPLPHFIQGARPHPPPPPPPHAGHFQGHDRPRHGPRDFRMVLHLLKFAAIGFLLCCLVSTISHRICSPSRRADRRTRREERRRRRSLKRARMHHAFRRFLARVTGKPFNQDSDDYEEKREALLANAEDGLSVTMSDEITQFRNAAGVVGEIIAAEGQLLRFPPRVDSRSMMAREVGRQVRESEDLPAYEDDDDSEMSSIADGIRYTPGSTDYDPSQSREGSVSDILGPDTKT